MQLRKQKRAESPRHVLEEYTTPAVCTDGLYFDLLDVERALESHLNQEPRLYRERFNALKITQAIKALLAIYPQALCEARIDLA